MKKVLFRVFLVCAMTVTLSSFARAENISVSVSGVRISVATLAFVGE